MESIGRQPSSVEDGTLNEMNSHEKPIFGISFLMQRHFQLHSHLFEEFLQRKKWPSKSFVKNETKCA